MLNHPLQDEHTKCHIFSLLVLIYTTLSKEYFKYTIKRLNSQELFYFPNAFPASAIPNEPSVTTTNEV